MHFYIFCIFTLYNILKSTFLTVLVLVTLLLILAPCVVPTEGPGGS